MKLNSLYCFALMAALSFVLCSCDVNYFEKKEVQKNGEVVIAKIETFQREKGRLPENLAEIGVKEDERGPILYKKKDSSNYEIWGTFGFDQLTYVYDSETKKWELRGG